MARKIFVNLPVKDLKRSVDFFTALGFSFNEKFTDETATCMVISDDIYAMLLTREKFASFLPQGRTIADGASATETLIALSCESKDEVHALFDKALKAGAREARPMADHGFMMERSFLDPDGHIWELFWMDPKMAEG